MRVDSSSAEPTRQAGGTFTSAPSRSGLETAPPTQAPSPSSFSTSSPFGPSSSAFVPFPASHPTTQSASIPSSSAATAITLRFTSTIPTFQDTTFSWPKVVRGSFVVGGSPGVESRPRPPHALFAVPQLLLNHAKFSYSSHLLIQDLGRHRCGTRLNGVPLWDWEEDNYPVVLDDGDKLSFGFQDEDTPFITNLTCRVEIRSLPQPVHRPTLSSPQPSRPAHTPPAEPAPASCQSEPASPLSSVPRPAPHSQTTSSACSQTEGAAHHAPSSACTPILAHGAEVSQSASDIDRERRSSVPPLDTAVCARLFPSPHQVLPIQTTVSSPNSTAAASLGSCVGAPTTSVPTSVLEAADGSTPSGPESALFSDPDTQARRSSTSIPSSFHSASSSTLAAAPASSETLSVLGATNHFPTHSFETDPSVTDICRERRAQVPALGPALVPRLSTTGVGIYTVVGKVTPSETTSVSTTGPTSGLTSGLGKLGDQIRAPQISSHIRTVAPLAAQEQATSASPAKIVEHCDRSLVYGCSVTKPPRSFDTAFIATQRMRSAWVTARRDAQYVQKTRSLDIALCRLRATFEQLSDKPMSTSTALSSSPLHGHPSAACPHPASTVRESLPHTPTFSRSTALASSEVQGRSFTARPVLLPAVPFQSPHAYFLAPLHALYHVLNTIAIQIFSSSHSYTSDYQQQLHSPSPAPPCSALSPLLFH
ncbi:hypothetical protein CF336_g4691 [Tilletia laevis]|nr:hypothetical protein CF336_g4691 [Tilletia laevis]